MGYSHSFSLNTELTDGVLKDIRKMLKNHDYLSIEEGENEEPLVTKEIIRFNGYDEEDSYETFLVEPYCSSFCKTNERRYDLAVCEVLLILKAHFRDKFDLSSDGFWVSESQFNKGELDGCWNIALDNIEREFGFTFEFEPEISYSGNHAYYSYKIK